MSSAFFRVLCSAGLLRQSAFSVNVPSLSSSTDAAMPEGDWDENLSRILLALQRLEPSTRQGYRHKYHTSRVVGLSGLEKGGLRVSPRGLVEAHRAAIPNMFFDKLFAPKEPKEFVPNGQVPSYEVIESFAEFEVRRYQDMTVLDVPVKQEGMDGYDIISLYTGGENEYGVKLPPTWPIMSLLWKDPPRRHVMLPSPHTQNDPSKEMIDGPEPTFQFDGGLLKRRGLTVAVKRLDPASFLPEVKVGKASLESDLTKEGLTFDASEAIYANFNTVAYFGSNTRKEVWIPVEV